MHIGRFFLLLFLFVDDAQLRALSFVFAPLSLFAAVLSALRIRQRLDFYENGLVWQEALNKRQFHFSELQRISAINRRTERTQTQFGPTDVLHYDCQLLLRDGTTHTLHTQDYGNLNLVARYLRIKENPWTEAYVLHKPKGDEAGVPDLPAQTP